MSLLSSSFLPADSQPVKFVSIKGVSQQPMIVPVHKVDIDIPTLCGSYQVAILDKLPPNTFLLGTDFGKEQLLTLMSLVKLSPLPALAVTRAMARDDDVASKTAETLQLSEGAFPRALEDIPEEFYSETDVPVPDNDSACCFPAPEESESPVRIPSSSSPASSPIQSDYPSFSAIPTFVFDGISKDEFLSMSNQTPLLPPCGKMPETTDVTCLCPTVFL